MNPGASLEGLRRANPEDAHAVAALVRNAYGHYVDRMGTDPAPMLQNYEHVIRSAEVWVVATTASGIEAVIVLDHKPGHLFVENVAVAPASQGKGLGRVLLAFAEDRARQVGVPEMRLYTNVLMTENIALYRRLGWVEVDRGIEDGFHRVFMTYTVR